MNLSKGFMTSSLLALAVGALPAEAESSVAITSVEVPAQTDTRVSVPVTRQAVGAFAVATNGVAGNTVTLDGAAFAVDQFPLNSQGTPLFYARFTSGDLAGRWFNIAGHDADSVNLNVEDSSTSADLSSVAEGDTLLIYPHWTIETLLPDGLEGYSFRESPNLFQPTFRILLPDNDGDGVNRPPSNTLLYVGDKWVFSNNADADDVVVSPQQTLLFRNPAEQSTGVADDQGTLVREDTGDLTFIPGGGLSSLDNIELIEVSSGQRDTVISAGNALPEELGALGLEAFLLDSGSLFNPKDRILLFPEPDPSNGFNVPPNRTILLVNGQLKDSNNQDADDIELRSGEVFIIRKDAGTPGFEAWQVGP